MAQIKKTPKPGELVRDAKAGDLVSFNKDGLPVDSGRAVTTYLPQILNTSRGKYLRVKSNQNIAEWGDLPEDILYDPSPESKTPNYVLTVEPDESIEWRPISRNVTNCFTVSEKVSVGFNTCLKTGNLITITARFLASESLNAGDIILTMTDSSVYPDNNGNNVQNNYSINGASHDIKIQTNIASGSTIIMNLFYSAQ